MWIVCITSVRHVLTVNGYGGRQTKENEKSWCFKGWETLVNKFPLNDKFRTFLLDNTNKVILVGNPMHHPRIKEMYMGQLRDCNNKPEVEGDE